MKTRYDYSVTTWKHVHAFIQDYCSFVNDYGAARIRTIAREGVYNTEKEYALALVSWRGDARGFTKISGKR